jgi:serine-type D-Ala-D-Ala endopeptidase (penicillin-binding protein 7)
VKTRGFRWAVSLAAALLWLAASPVAGLSAHALAAKKHTAKKAAAKHAGSKRAKVASKAKGRVSAKKAHARPATHKHVFLERRVVAVKSGQPNVQAQGALVLDDTNHEVYARNPDKERPIASISKLAATLSVVDKGLELEGLTTITRADIEVAKGGARSRLVEGITLSNRDLLHAALMGSDNRAIPALGRAVKLTPSQLTAAMNAKVRELGLKNTRFREPTGLSSDNVSTPRETIAMLRTVMSHPVLGPITRRSEYDAHPVGRAPIHYNNTDHPAARGNIQVLAGKTGYNDDARYCLVIATKVDGRPYFMAFLANEGKLTRFGDVARVADWIISRKPKSAPSPSGSASDQAVAAGAGPRGPATPPGEGTPEGDKPSVTGAATVLPIGVAAPPPAPDEAAPSGTASGTASGTPGTASGTASATAGATATANP